MYHNVSLLVLGNARLYEYQVPYYKRENKPKQPDVTESSTSRPTHNRYLGLFLGLETTHVLDESPVD